MTEKIFEQYMRTEPDSLEHRYLFLVDNKDLAFNIVAAGFGSVALLDNHEGYFDLESLMRHIESIEFSGTRLSSYIFIPACSTKKTNDRLATFFEEHFITYYEGWRLFRGKEYLTKVDAIAEIKNILGRFVEQHERKPKTEADLDRYHVPGKEGEPVGVMDIEIVEDILQTTHFFVLGATPYVYAGGVYREDAGGVHLKTIIQAYLYRKFIKSPVLNRVYGLLICQGSVQKRLSDLYNLPPEWINFRNGYYDPVEQAMHPHDPKYLCLNQIPHEFHPEQKDEILTGGGAIRNYLSTAIPDPLEQQMLWEYLGYCMTSDTKMQKFLMLVGEGGTGKSVIISLFQKVIGIDNCSSISLQDLNRRFYATGLFGKLLNACGDIPCKALESVDVLKKAVGEDSIIYEKKGQDALQFFSHAKLLFSSNGMPDNVEEKSDAFYRRLLILEMNHKPEEKDPKLKKKIAQEIDFAIHMAVSALHDLYERGRLCESDNSKRCVREARKSADSVMAFVEEALINKPGAWLPRSSAYDAYEEYCRENGRQPLGKAKFVPEMRRKGYTAVKYQGIFKYRDIAIRTADFEELPEGEATPFD